ncbi:MAG: formylglycine-generating enzyme family protein [Deltaproteobacteria bacterium]|nr:formylglycine-generating enzyme family protein [Deltaproteobacteria bacterium]
MRNFASLFLSTFDLSHPAGAVRREIPMSETWRSFCVSPLFRMGALALGLLAGCATEPEPPVQCAANGCNDGNPCTKDECEPLSGCKHSPLDGATCSDGDICTTGDTCKAGACAAGAALACNDDNVCTKDACDPTKGCTFTPTAGPCDDGNACTEGDACKAGSCGSGAIKVCNDGDPCTTDACAAGACTAKPATGSPCDDGDACTKADSCGEKGCVGIAIVCSDANPCTNESCDKKSGCKTTVHNDPCDDGNKCTKADICNDGACKGVSVDCDDGVSCTLESCDPATGCQLAAVATLCSDDNACTADTCDPKAGCAHTQLDKPCDDGSLCTQGDQCAKGYCTGKPVSCDDDNACTLDVCTPEEGCKHNLVADGKLCNDADACTTADICKAGKCKGAVDQCDDGNACTTDDCDPKTGCSQKPVAASPCDDFNACTVGDHCDNYKCNPGKTKKDCDDKNPCTVDECDAKEGCKNTMVADGGACSDGDACTNDDACSGGKCAAKPLMCNDNNTCTDDSCDKAKGCVFAPVAGKTCDDKDACTIGDSCDNGSCVPGKTATDCDDKNACTVDSCTPSTGCIHTIVAFKKCDDGDACTADDTCTAQGVCESDKPTNCNDDNACTDDACDKKSGCAHTPTVAACNDGNVCTVGEKCSAGKCEGGKPLSCDDGNGCTSDACKSEDGKGGGCEYKPNAGVPCDDGNACTAGDACGKTGNCGGTKMLDCNDNQACTTEYCAPDQGCVVKPVANGTSCSDGNACSWDDKCAAGACAPGNKANCDDFNPCTDDVCLPKLGCQHEALGAQWPCNDGVACTTASHCEDGACKVGEFLDCNDANPCTVDVCVEKTGKCSNVLQPGLQCTDGNDCTVGDKCTDTGCKGNGKDCGDNNACTADTCSNNTCFNAPIQCDDNNACTNDACIPSNGCLHVANTVACDDGNACTALDKCTSKFCIGTAKVECDDGNPCTADGCDAKTGCTHKNLTGTDCTDNDACTVNEVCSNGQCKTTPKNCSDGNDCTIDSCSKATGCNYSATPEWTPCYNDEFYNLCDGKKNCVSSVFSSYLMAPVPAGTSAFGCDAKSDANCPSDAKPAHLAAMPAFWLDIFEVTVGHYKQCVAAKACTKPADNWFGTYYENGTDNDKRPVNVVTWSQADKYCAWRNKRLPTEHELERATRGGCKPGQTATCLAETQPYAWGFDKPSCKLANFSESANNWGCGTYLPWDWGNGAPGPFLYHFELSGNVWEWTSDHYSATWYTSLSGAGNGEPKANPVQTTLTGLRSIRGGGFDSAAPDLRAYVRKGVAASYQHPNLGFRCAQSPK